MNRFRNLIFAVVLVALGVWLWTVLFPSPEKVIRKRLAEVARSVSFAANEGPLARMSNVARLSSFISEDIEVKLDLPGLGQIALSGRDQITQAVMAARSWASALNVELLDPDVSVASDKQSAVVDLTAKVKIPGEKDFAVQEMKFNLKKSAGDWLVTRVETVKTLL